MVGKILFSPSTLTFTLSANSCISTNYMTRKYHHVIIMILFRSTCTKGRKTEPHDSMRLCGNDIHVNVNNPLPCSFYDDNQLTLYLVCGV